MSWPHKPEPWQRPVEHVLGRGMWLCGHRFKNGRYCAFWIYEARHPSGEYHWRHNPAMSFARIDGHTSGGFLGHNREAMPVGYEPFIEAEVKL